MPSSVSFTYLDLKYPSATGELDLLNAIRDYYNTFYGSNITTDNIAVFAGGRPAIYATLAFLKKDVKVLIEETEYTPYYDALKLLDRKHQLIPSNPENHFSPTLQDYKNAQSVGESVFVVKSNPCNPTGITWTGDKLRDMVDFCSQEGSGGLFDEAYEFFHEPAPVSAMKYLDNINRTNVFVVSAATKGLQAPGLRVGWIVSSLRNIELFRNFSSIAMGGVARPSQIVTAQLLNPQRVELARNAIGQFYGKQRARYGEALRALGFILYTGEGGFYHWARLPQGLTAEEFNERLFLYKAAILPGTLCDMLRRGNRDSPHRHFVRFSFGPLKESSFEQDVEILTACLVATPPPTPLNV